MLKHLPLKVLLFILFETLVTTSALAREAHYGPGELGYPVRGWEYRESKSFPEDSGGSGHLQNARTSLLEFCQNQSKRILAAYPDKIQRAGCDPEEALKLKPGRAQFEAVFKIETSLPHVIETDLNQSLDTGLVDIQKFTGQWRWQESRRVAREIYAQKCNEFENSARNSDPAHFLWVDCGLVRDLGGARGWQFVSRPAAFFMSDAPIPKDCGVHRHGSTWWVEDLSGEISVPQSCEFGGNEARVYRREVFLYCRDGQEMPTGQERAGAYLRTDGRCERPRSCGVHSHGDIWWERSGIRSAMESCPIGFEGYVDVTYEMEREHRCQNGRVDRTFNERRGRIISEVDHCRRIDHGGRGGRGGNRGHRGGRA